MTMQENELSLLVRGLSDKRRAKLMKRLKISESTLYRWLKDPRKYITIATAPVFKAVLDTHYGGDHDINALSRPVRIHGRKSVTA